MTRPFQIFSIGLVLLVVALGGSSENTLSGTAARGSSETTRQYIDVHAHLQGAKGSNWASTAAVALASMNKWGIKTMLLLPPPFSNQPSQSRGKYECDEMSTVLSQYPGRFAFLCGGGTLNVLIQQAVTQGGVSVQQFKTEAERIAGLPGFVGFGEMTTLHFCMGEGHVYEAAPPDHELFKVLVDVAAQKGAPIDIHQEAVPSDMPFPPLVPGGCSANPATLTANIEKFKNLLTYAKSKNVKIIWDHLGWDNTRQRTVALSGELLGQHDNLYYSIKNSPRDSPEDNRIVDTSGKIKPEWLTLFQKYPTRFMIGSDQFFVSPRINQPFPPSVDETWAILSQLPEDLRKRIGYENARAVFKFSD